MKRLIFFLVLAVTQVVAYAQQDYDALRIALAQVLHEQGVFADTMAIELSQKFKKSAEAQTAIATAYHQNRESSKAKMYIEKAFEANPNYAPAFILRGDMFEFYGEPDSAMVWYEKGILADPKNPDLYVKYAASPNATMENINHYFDILREARPDINVDVLMAQAQLKHGTLNDTFASYDKLWSDYGIDAFDGYSISIYTSLLAGYGRNEDALDVALKGYQKWPDNYGVVRAVMNSYGFMDKEDDVLRYADKLMALTDSLVSGDYFQLGKAYMYKGQIERAFETFAKIEDTRDGSRETNYKNAQHLVNSYVDELSEKKDYDGAIALYNKYIEVYKPRDMAAAYNNLSSYYRKKHIDAPESEKNDTRRDLFAIYEKIEKEFPDSKYSSYAYYNHAYMIVGDLDSRAETGEAIPIFLNFVSSAERNNLVEKMIDQVCYGYQYIMGYYSNKGDMNNVREYCNKILDLDPTHQAALRTLSALGPDTPKGKKRKK